MSFISAGTSAPLELLEEVLLNPQAKESDPEEKNDRNHSPDDAQVSPPTEAVIDTLQDISSNDQDVLETFLGPEDLERHIREGGQNEANQDSFFFDIKDDTLPDVNQEAPVVPDRPDPVSSESSDEEVILFKGRDNTQAAGTTKTTMAMSQIRTEIQVVEAQLQAPPTHKPSVSRRGGKDRRRQKVQDDDDDAMLADYIANMRETGEISDLLKSDHRNRRDLGGPLSDDSTDESSDDEETADVEGGKPTEPEADEDPSESELDDETLAKLIAGQDPGSLDPDADIVDIPSDSDSSDDIMTRAQYITAAEQFDFMDWDQPVLRKKKKGKAARAQMNFGLSDSEMEQQLQAAYKNDRLKKAQRKQQREEMRALGQLGKNSKGPEDMMVKYPGGMTLDQVADEIRSFMLARRET